MRRQIISLAFSLASVALILVGIGHFYKVDVHTPTKLVPRATVTPRPNPLPVALIVPHHQLVATQRAELFTQAATTGLKPKTIVLVSPNHYESGSGAIQTTPQSWSTDAGIIDPDLDLIKRVEKDGVTEEIGSFTNEHGIRNILHDIAHTFPGAKIVPLIIGSKATQSQATKLADDISDVCPDCLVIASVDFSHYQPAKLGELHDAVSIRALDNLDLDTLTKVAEVDSPLSLVLASRFATDRAAGHFVLKNHTNSGVLVKDLDGEGTTHLFGWYEPGAKTVPAASVSFLLGGDIMLDRSVADQYFFKNGGKFTQVVDKFSPRTFWGADLGMLNHEGPIASGPVDNNVTSNNLVFNFPPQSIDVVKALHVNAVSLANNHSLNAGQAGLENTRSVLTAAGVTPVGGPSDVDTVKALTISGQGISLHVITVLTLDSNPDLSSLIKSLKQTASDRVLVFPHWGVEYQTTHSSGQASQAHAWIDAGADLVIGAHPHVVQDSELYKGVPIIYSMGNLIFDQGFSVETQRGMLVGGEFTDQGLRIFGLPVGIKSSAPSLLTGAEKATRLSRIYDPLKSSLRTTETGTELYFPRP